MNIIHWNIDWNYLCEDPSQKAQNSNYPGIGRESEIVDLLSTRALVVKHLPVNHLND